MAFDLQEQEQFDQLKTFWERGGKWFAMLVLLSLFSFLGYTVYKYYQVQQNISASKMFFQLNNALAKQDMVQADKMSTQLKSKYPKSAYASRAAFFMAKFAFDKGNFSVSKENLLWIESNSQESAIKSIARLRLAFVFLDEKKYDEALNELNHKHDKDFDAQFFDAKGDVLQAKGDSKAAKDSFASAEKIMKKNIPEYAILKLKLSSLGG